MDLSVNSIIVDEAKRKKQRNRAPEGVKKMNIIVTEK